MALVKRRRSFMGGSNGGMILIAYGIVATFQPKILEECTLPMGGFL